MTREFQDDIYCIKVGVNPKDCMQFRVGGPVNLGPNLRGEISRIVEDYNASVVKGVSIYRVYVLPEEDEVDVLWQTFENVPVTVINRI